MSISLGFHRDNSRQLIRPKVAAFVLVSEPSELILPPEFTAPPVSMPELLFVADELVFDVVVTVVFVLPSALVIVVVTVVVVVVVPFALVTVELLVDVFAPVVVVPPLPEVGFMPNEPTFGSVDPVAGVAGIASLIGSCVGFGFQPVDPIHKSFG
jgi:hypothetical protein